MIENLASREFLEAFGEIMRKPLGTRREIDGKKVVVLNGGMQDSPKKFSKQTLCWSPEDRELLVKRYSTMTAKQIQPLFRGDYSLKAIWEMARKMKLGRRRRGK